MSLVFQNPTSGKQASSSNPASKTPDELKGWGPYWYGFSDITSNRKPEPDEILNVPPLRREIQSAGG